MSYGSGLALDENFDLVIDSVGDLDYTEGVSEVEKDLAFRVTSALRYGTGVEQPASMSEGAVGGTLRPGDLADMELVVSDIISSDPRISGVRSVDVDLVDDNSGEVSVTSKVVIDTETAEFDFIVDTE